MSNQSRPLVAASTRTVPREIRRKQRGIFAVDATHVPMPGRPDSKRSELHATIYDAGWYVRDEGDGNGHNGNAASRKTRQGKVVWALELEVVVRGALSHTKSSAPLLIHAINVHKPAAYPAASAAQAIQLLPELYPDQILEYLVGDNLYLPNSKPDTFQGPMRNIGFKLAMDYPRNQKGIQDQYAGALLVDGSWMCPAIPKNLIEATRQYDEKTIDAQTLAQRIEGRRAFLLQPKKQPMSTGNAAYQSQKWRCPAAGPSPTVRCPLKPNLKGKPSKHLLPAMLPSHPDKVCTNRESITIPGEVGLKTRQDIPYLIEEWKAHYSGPRSKVESVNNKIKSSAHEGLGASSSRLARSATAHTIFAAIAVVASNCSRVFAFLKTYEADLAEHDTPKNFGKGTPPHHAVTPAQGSTGPP